MSKAVKLRAFGYFLALASAMVLGGATFRRQEIADGYRFALDGVGVQRIVGVCEVTDSVISCWKPDGTRDPQLTDTIRTYYRSPGASKIEVRYGHAMSLLAVGTRQSVGQTIFGTPGLVLRNDRMTWTGSIPAALGEETLDQFEVYPDPNQSSFDVPSEYTKRLTETADLKVRAGSEATLHGIRIKVVGVSEAKRPTIGFGDLKAWRVTLATSGEDAACAEFHMTPIGKDFLEIGLVDSVGNPIRGPVDNSSGMSRSPVYEATPTEFLTLVNPAKMNCFRVSMDLSYPILFKNVALNPRG